MVRKTPIPLLRDLQPNVLVIRCLQCGELVLFSELCQDPISASCCPRRAQVEAQMPLPITLAQAIAHGQRLVTGE